MVQYECCLCEKLDSGDNTVIRVGKSQEQGLEIFCKSCFGKEKIEEPIREKEMRNVGKETIIIFLVFSGLIIICFYLGWL